MEKEHQHTKILDFIPDPNGNLIAVLTPSPYMEMLGTIEKEMDKGTGEIKYSLSDNFGNQIFPPTTDLAEAERKFEQYSIWIQDEKRNQMGYKNTAEREDELRSIREAKNEKEQEHDIDL